MPKTGSVEDLTVEELRRLLVEKRRASRQDRLEQFRRTGRVVMVTPNVESGSLDNLRSGTIDDVEETSPKPKFNREASASWMGCFWRSKSWRLEVYYSFSSMA